MADSSSGDGGRVIAGRYQLSKQLGQGGMGSVWCARDLTLGSPVAIKLIDAALAQDEGLRARFLQEARSAAALRSPHVVQIFEYGVDEGVPFIAMELLEGESLADRLARVRVLPYAETARVLLDVARAMKKAHDAGIVHRDLKPDNIFLVRNDDQEVAKVLDFGIAKATDATGAQRAATRTGALLGTLPYMSPEQASGARTVDWRSDVWAMGVIAFECVCGRMPFTSDATGELVLEICAHPLPVPSQIAGVPPGFDAWWTRAANRDPSRRFQSAKELAEALAAVLTPAVAAPSSVAAVSAPSSLPAPSAAAPERATTFGRSTVTTDVGAAGALRRTRPLVLGGAAVAIVAAGAAVAWGVGRPGAGAAASVATDGDSSPPAVVAAPTSQVGTPSPPTAVPSVVPADPAAEQSARPDATASATATPASAGRASRGAASLPPAPKAQPPAPTPAKKRTMD
jgi:serine/threonine-protein kinase